MSQTAQDLAEKLSAQPDVEWAVPDQRRRINAASNDPLLADNQPTATPVAGQWYLFLLWRWGQYYPRGPWNR